MASCPVLDRLEYNNYMKWLFFKLLFLALFVLITGGGGVFASAPPVFDVLTTTAAPLNSSSGGLFFRWSLKKRSSEFLYRSDDRYLAELILYRQSGQKFYRIKQYSTDNSGDLNRVWSLPAGKYVLVRATLQDSKRRDAIWVPSQGAGVVFEVPSGGGIAHFGKINFEPQSAFILAMSMTKERLARDNTELTLRSPGKKVVDAVSGQALSNKKEFRSTIAVDEVGGDYTPTAIASYRVTAKPLVSKVKFDVEVFSPKSKQSVVQKSLDASLRKFVSCYENALSLNSGLEGDLTLAFVYKSTAKRIVSVQARSGSLRDPTLVGCMGAELGRVDLKTGKDTLGVIAYTFIKNG